MDALVLAVTQENADAILDGKRRFDHRRLPPKRLPARAYLAVSGEGVVGECELGAPERETEDGWALPVSKPRRYRTARDLDAFGLRKTPRSFQYIQASEGFARAKPQGPREPTQTKSRRDRGLTSSPASTRSSRA